MEQQCRGPADWPRGDARQQYVAVSRAYQRQILCVSGNCLSALRALLLKFALQFFLPVRRQLFQVGLQFGHLAEPGPILLRLRLTFFCIRL
jgi:hypothetical protein